MIGMHNDTGTGIGILLKGLRHFGMGLHHELGYSCSQSGSLSRFSYAILVRLYFQLISVSCVR